MDIATVIKQVGLTPIARACAVSPSAVHKWQTRNRLPRTEWTGETAYAARIAELHGGVSAEELLQITSATAQP
jgi:predicted lysophospholipase L1 biosynthesis ABC-type transport system permease subunit